MKNNLRKSINLIVEEAGTKQYDPKLVENSVVIHPSAKENRQPLGPILFNVATAADEFTPWGYDVYKRDQELRNFWHTEPILASAVAAMATRLSVVDFEIIGSDPTKPKPTTTIASVESMLKNADYGQGWMSFVIKIAIDIYTQDNGAFIELVRRENNPFSAVIGINHLDSARCFRTGDPEKPIRYRDRNGLDHTLNWWNVVAITEMPSPIEEMFGVGYCAVTRCLRAAQIIRDIAIYKKEKVSGQFMRTIHFISGVTEDNIDAALTFAREQQLNLNLFRYTQPTIMPTLDPDTTLQHIQIDLATLPDNFDEEISFKWYISQLALAFGVDYQEFAPLPGGNLGSGQQSEILHLKSRGKGPALLMSRLENIFNNFGIIPRTVKFGFKVQDSRAEAERATARFERGKDRAARIQSGELDPEAAVELAVLDGDLPEYIAEDRKKRPMEAPGSQDPVTMSSKQVSGGVNSQMRRSYSNDDMRAAVLRRLQRRNELSTGHEINLTQEDIEAERRRLAFAAG